MAFSFFKKSGTRMPESVSVPAARPMGMTEATASRTQTQTGGLGSNFLNVPDFGNAPSFGTTTAGVSAPVQDSDWTLVPDDIGTRVNGGYGVEILVESDPYTEVAEHAAIAYANGQNSMAQSTLESAIQDNSDPGALKLWHMLFDFFRMTANQAGFDALGAEFAKTCELSPPSWDVAHSSTKGKGGKPGVSGLVILQGVLSTNNPALEILRKALVNKEPRRLDLGRLAGIDADGADALAEILIKARKLDLAWGITQADSQADRLAVRLSSEQMAGQKSEAGLWKLLFELYHFSGRAEDFEDKAVDYAVAFEHSPPSWEPPKTPPAIPDAATDGEEEDAGAEPARLEGTLLQGNMEAVQRLLKKGEENRLDFSGVSRVDFASAGALVSILRDAGHVTIVHPNRLVAELLRVMGVDQVARIELSRY